ncbi:DUF1853 family protein [Mesonia sp. HuA40]|uniref:DUF1853 family protein n=1 Tax=Mesonia sp. HuA40 TaxID=2602761 RepID=UPI0011C93148|nr:DUF1853 family protein [Mesonia sp. HuA40]TXK72593.1 DUF1853 family protein [Mesonia sp. HuA40]
MRERYKNQLQFLGYQKTHHLILPDSFYGIDFFKLPTKENPIQAEELASLPDKLVLGKRAEAFFEAEINKSNRYDMLGSNLQIIEDKITLGEIDFLLKDLSSGDFLHVELVYKFYLLDTRIQNPLEAWVGANRKDSLLRKLDHLKNHQLPLLQNHSVQYFLKKLGINPNQIKNQYAHFKAHLFLPKGYNKSILPYLNPNCISGTYVDLNSFTSDTYFRDKFYYSPFKKDWSISPHLDVNWVDYNKQLEEVDFLAQNKKSSYLWVKNKLDLIELIFVVWWPIG